MALSDEFKYAVSKLGKSSGRVPVSAADVEGYRSRVPNSLIDFWIETGWGNYAHGLLKVADPALLEPVLPLLFPAGDQDFKAADCVIYAFTAFGRLFIWHRQYGGIQINLLRYELNAAGLLRPDNKASPEKAVAVPLGIFKPTLHDIADVTGAKLFEPACAALGRPALDECFGFFPALPLGGVASVEKLRRVKAREHFAILAQLRPLQLVDYSTLPAKVLREL